MRQCRTSSPNTARMTPPRPLPPAGSNSAPLRVAIAGCHRQLTTPLAGHNFSSALAVSVDIEVVGAFDHGAQTRGAYSAGWGVPAYDDFSRMLAAARPDILCIATRQVAVG